MRFKKSICLVNFCFVHKQAMSDTCNNSNKDLFTLRNIVFKILIILQKEERMSLLKSKRSVNGVGCLLLICFMRLSIVSSLNAPLNKKVNSVYDKSLHTRSLQSMDLIVDDDGRNTEKPSEKDKTAAPISTPTFAPVTDPTISPIVTPITSPTVSPTAAPTHPKFGIGYLGIFALTVFVGFMIYCCGCCEGFIAGAIPANHEETQPLQCEPDVENAVVV